MARPWTGQVAASAASFTGTRPFLAAMHVHGSWSEQGASWESYGPRGQGLVDVIFMTDHDYRALADRYWTSLQDAPFRSTSTGSFKQKARPRGGSLSLLAESATSSTASVTMAVDDVSSKAIWDKLRTSIEGQSLRHTFGSSRLTNGATYEVRIRLSNHPVTASRPAGTFQLWFRFGAGLAAGRHLEAGGLVGVVTQGLPAAGTTVTLDLQSQVQQLWPDMTGRGQRLLRALVRGHQPRERSGRGRQGVGPDVRPHQARRGVDRGDTATAGRHVRTALRVDDASRHRGRPWGAAHERLRRPAVHPRPESEPSRQPSTTSTRRP